MPRLSYNQMEAKINVISLHILSVPDHILDDYLKLYHFLLSKYGWDSISFDREMLKRIDSNWDGLPIIWN